MAENLSGKSLVINEHSQFCNPKAGHVRLHYVMVVEEFSKRILKRYSRNNSVSKNCKLVLLITDERRYRFLNSKVGISTQIRWNVTSHCI